MIYTSTCNCPQEDRIIRLSQFDRGAYQDGLPHPHFAQHPTYLGGAARTRSRTTKYSLEQNRTPQPVPGFSTIANYGTMDHHAEEYELYNDRWGSDAMEASNTVFERFSVTPSSSAKPHTTTTPLLPANNLRDRFDNLQDEEKDFDTNSTAAEDGSNTSKRYDLAKATISGTSAFSFLIGIFGFIGACTIIFMTEAGIILYPILLYNGTRFRTFPGMATTMCLRYWYGELAVLPYCIPFPLPAWLSLSKGFVESLLERREFPARSGICVLYFLYCDVCLG